MKIAFRLLAGLSASSLAVAVLSQSGSPSLRSLIDSERAFSSLSADKGVREAFLSYLADDAVVFRPKPVPGRKVYEEMPAASPLLLTWEPAFAEVSAAGDLGYTTGPYQARDRTKPEQSARYGHYISVWERQGAWKWKVVFDGGIRHPEPGSQPQEVATRPDKVKTWTGGKVDRIQGRKTLIDLERGFAALALSAGLVEAYLAYADSDIRVYRDNVLPMTGKEALLKEASKAAGKWTWDPLDGAASSVADLGYVYGICDLTGAGAGNAPAESSSYLRIWRRSSGGQWRIVLDLAVPIPAEK
jgi:ketosteroid isomerase-like protein